MGVNLSTWTRYFGIHHFLQPNLRWFSDTLKVPQIMVNWWLGARWFEFLGSPYEKWLLLRVPRLNPKLLSFSWQHFLTKNINFLWPVTCRLCFFVASRHSLRQRRNEPWSCGVVGGTNSGDYPTEIYHSYRKMKPEIHFPRALIFARWISHPYPTLGRGKLSSKVPWDGNCLFAGGYIWECAPNTVSSFIRT